MAYYSSNKEIQNLDAAGTLDGTELVPIKVIGDNHATFCTSQDIANLATVGSGVFDSTVDFSVHADPNTIGTVFSPNTPALTTVIYVDQTGTLTNGAQWTYNGSTYITYKPLFWSKLGDAGTTPGTHFVGTTDNKGLMFKTNNIQSGYLDSIHNSISFGTSSLILSTGSANVAIGNQSMNINTTGFWNVAIGAGTLSGNVNATANTAIGYGAMSTVNTSSNVAIGKSALNTSTGNTNIAIGVSALGGGGVTGSNNLAVGHNAMYSNTSGANNIGIGYLAGFYNTTASNQIFINSIPRANYAADQTASPIYIQQNATVSSQKIFMNGLLNFSSVPTYTDNAAAIVGGLVAGNIYKINAAGTYTLAIVV